MNTILEAKDLCKSFSNGSVQQHVLKNLNLKIEQGEFIVIMGNSGSGKSTLLYSLSGIDKPTLGTVRIDGSDITPLSNDKLAVFRRNHCGFVFQQNYLNDTMTVLDNIVVCGLLSGQKKKDLKAQAEKLVQQMNLSVDVLKKYPSQLSGGEQQRIAMVRGIINKPAILFADEPTGALNSQSSDQVLDVLTRLNNEGQTIIMVTHDVKSARRADRILYLRDGVIVSELNQGKYVSKDTARHEALRSFLREMGW